MHLVTSAAAAEPTTGIAGWAAHLVDVLGGPGAGLAIALENLFPPLPSEVILPLTGFAAGQGAISSPRPCSGRRSARLSGRRSSTGSAGSSAVTGCTRCGAGCRW